MRGPISLKVLVLAALLAPLATGCVKKGKGKGTRAIRPDSNGTIFDDGDKNQNPKPKQKEDQMTEEAKAILAACFKIDVTEVETIVGWTKDTSADAAKALCAKIEKTGYKDGILATTEPVEID